MNIFEHILENILKSKLKTFLLYASLVCIALGGLIKATCAACRLYEIYLKG